MPEIAKSPTKRARLAAWLEQNRPPVIDPSVAAEIASILAPVSESYLRGLLRASGVPLHPLVDGVRQDTLPELEASLIDLSRLYESAPPPTKDTCRRLVITAKDRARWAARRASDPARQAEKQQMVDFMLTWLENPGIFEVWIRARRARASA